MSNSPHDALIKAILGEPKHAVAALRPIVPAVLRDVLDWSALRRENASYVSVDGGARHSESAWAMTATTAAQACIRAPLYLVHIKEGAPDAVRQVIAMLPPEAQEDIVSAYDRILAEGEAIGAARGKAEGRRITLAKLLQLKFGALSDDVHSRLDAADDVALDLWTERVLFANTLDQIFAP